LERSQVSRLTRTSTPRASTLELRPFDDAYLRRSAPPTRRIYGRVTCLMRPCAIYIDVLSADRESANRTRVAECASKSSVCAVCPRSSFRPPHPRNSRWSEPCLEGETSLEPWCRSNPTGGMEPSETRLLPMRMLSPAEAVDHIIGWRELARGRLPISAGAAQPAHEWLVDLELIAVHLRHPSGPRSGLTSPGRPHDTARSGGSSSD
jgi:hypothetical protein